MSIWFYIAMGILVLATVACWWLYHRFVVMPRRTLVIGTDMLRQQDFNSRLRKLGHREVDQIIDLFNPMMDALDVKSQKIEEQEKFLNLIMAISPMAIAVVNDRGAITYSNPAFQNLADKDVWELARKLALDESKVFRMNTGAAYRGSHLSYIDQGFPHDFYIIETLTAEVAEAERHAYEQVIRTLSHEVNNTVCGVNSTLEAISEIVGEEDARRVIAECEKRATGLAEFVQRYAKMVKLPEPQPVPTDLYEFIESNRLFLENLCRSHGCKLILTGLQGKQGFPGQPGQPGQPRHLGLLGLLGLLGQPRQPRQPGHLGLLGQPGQPGQPRLSGQPRQPDESRLSQPSRESRMSQLSRESRMSQLISLDPGLMEQVLINLVKNGAENPGATFVAIAVGDRCLEVINDGEPISHEVSQRLFTPFFTTKPTGQGIGLTTIRTILTLHHARFSLATGSDRLTRFTILFPA